MTNDDGVKWLEIQRVGGGDFQGMVLYTSVLDASIAAEVLNQSDSRSEWKACSFADLYARNAASTAIVTTTPMMSAAPQYRVSTCSAEKQTWVVSSLAVHGSRAANKLH